MILARRSLEVFGDIVGGRQREMTGGKVKALLEWPPPETLKSLQKFLGTLNYSKRFIGPKYGGCGAFVQACAGRRRQLSSLHGSTLLPICRPRSFRRLWRT